MQQSFLALRFHYRYSNTTDSSITSKLIATVIKQSGQIQNIMSLIRET